VSHRPSGPSLDTRLPVFIGARSGGLRGFLSQQVLPAIDEFRPEMVVLSLRQTPQDQSASCPTAEVGGVGGVFFVCRGSLWGPHC
jgi:hypothetical protein